MRHPNEEKEIQEQEKKKQEQEKEKQEQEQKAIEQLEKYSTEIPQLEDYEKVYETLKNKTQQSLRAQTALPLEKSILCYYHITKCLALIFKNHN